MTRVCLRLSGLVLVLFGALALAAPAQAGYIHVGEPDINPLGCGTDMGPPRLEAPLQVSLEETPDPVPDQEVILQLIARLHSFAPPSEGASTPSTGGSTGSGPAPVASLPFSDTVLPATLHGVLLPGQGPSLPDPIALSLFHPPRA